MRMRTLAATFLAFGLVGGVAVPAQRAEPAPGVPGRSRDGDRRFAESESDFKIWRQKAQLEVESLQAQLEMKKAEIRRREAEFRIGQVTRDLAILSKLDEPVAMRFANETPFEDVLKYIKAATRGPKDNGIPIYVDPVGLQKADKTMTSTVTLDLEGVPLRITLRLVLKQLGLVYTVKDGLLTISAEPGAAPETP